MPYIYRYINLDKAEVVYIGKVTKYRDVGYNPLERRHEQHTREEWYRNIGGENILMQYIELQSHTDADIYETWLINYYGKTGQLVNLAKIGWGESNIDMHSLIFGRWKNYRGGGSIQEQLQTYTERLYNATDGLRFHLESALESFNQDVKSLYCEVEKADKINRFDTQNEFLRGYDEGFINPNKP